MEKKHFQSVLNCTHNSSWNEWHLNTLNTHTIILINSTKEHQQRQTIYTTNDQKIITKFGDQLYKNKKKHLTKNDCLWKVVLHTSNTFAATDHAISLNYVIN